MKIKQAAIIANQPADVPPVYFQSLTISGVKCFRDETKFSFADEKGRPFQWSVILGENGMGKTTLLQCLTGMSARPGSLNKKDGTQEPMIETYWSGSQWLQWHIERLPSLSKRFDCKATLAFDSLLTGKDKIKSQPWSFGLGASEEPDGQLTVQVKLMGGKPEQMAGFLVYAYGAGRRMATTSRIPHESSVDDAVRTIFDDDRPLMNAEEWLLELDHLTKTDHPGQKQALRQREDVKELLVRVLPDIEAIRTVVVTEKKSHARTVRVQFKTPFAWVGLERLCFGYQTMASWLVDLTRRLYNRYPESTNPIAEPAIVLVDELDLHLHPKWQQTVMDYLSERFVNTQFIVTAHSPLIIQSQRTANVILLGREGNKVVARQDFDAVREWRVDQILTSDLFGLERTRKPDIERIFDERSTLLGKAKLTAAERRRLNVLTGKIHQLPSGESKDMREVEAFLREVAKEKQPKTVGKK